MKYPSKYLAFLAGLIAGIALVGSHYLVAFIFFLILIVTAHESKMAAQFFEFLFDYWQTNRKFKRAKAEVELFESKQMKRLNSNIAVREKLGLIRHYCKLLETANAAHLNYWICHHADYRHYYERRLEEMRAWQMDLTRRDRR